MRITDSISRMPARSSFSNDTTLRDHCRQHFEELNDLSCAPDNYDIHDVFNMKGFVITLILSTNAKQS